MRLDTIHKTVNGKTYTSHLLREAYRDHGRVRHRTIANLSSCSDQEIRAIRLALKHKGVIERYFKTLKLECLWVHRFRDVEHARQIVGEWIETYNTQWIIERHRYCTPREVRLASEGPKAIAA